MSPQPTPTRDVLKLAAQQLYSISHDRTKSMVELSGKVGDLIQLIDQLPTTDAPVEPPKDQFRHEGTTERLYWACIDGVSVLKTESEVRKLRPDTPCMREGALNGEWKRVDQVFGAIAKDPTMGDHGMKETGYWMKVPDSTALRFASDEEARKLPGHTLIKGGSKSSDSEDGWQRADQVFRQAPAMPTEPMVVAQIEEARAMYHDAVVQRDQARRERDEAVEQRAQAEGIWKRHTKRLEDELVEARRDRDAWKSTAQRMEGEIAALDKERDQMGGAKMALAEMRASKEKLDHLVTAALVEKMDFKRLYEEQLQIRANRETNTEKDLTRALNLLKMRDITIERFEREAGTLVQQRDTLKRELGLSEHEVKQGRALYDNAVQERDRATAETAGANIRIECLVKSSAKWQDAIQVVFQDMQERPAILPDFLKLGDCKIEGVVRLARAHKNAMVELKQAKDKDEQQHEMASRLTEALKQVKRIANDSTLPVFV